MPTSPHPARGGGLSTVRVTGQALAATTTAAAGGLLGGAAGTVVGAGIASIVTTVGEALYLRSLERTRDRVRTRIDARRTRPVDQPPPDEAPTRVLTAPAPSTSSRGRTAVLVATAIVIFLIAMVVVTGIERVKGSPLSGGPAGTSVGEVFGTRAPATTTTAPDTDDDDGSGATATTAPEPTTSTAPTTTSRSRTTTPTTTLVPSGN